MRAAVIFEKGDAPQFITNYPEPAINGPDEHLVTMSAVAIKHLDKSRASGEHYTIAHDMARATVPGSDGTGTLADGTRVFIIGNTGTMAAYTLTDKHRMVAIPDSLDDALAAALPNAIAGSAMALRFRANIRQGDTVLINGATGFTGRVAVQIARYYGAGHIIATGRNEMSLQELPALGADEIVSLSQPAGKISAQLQQIHRRTPVSIILDYLWGPFAELLLEVLKGGGAFTTLTRYVSVGAVAGDAVRLSSGTLRSTNLQIRGSGLGSWTKDEMQLLFSEILPEMLHLAADGKLTADTVGIGLDEIASAWSIDVPGGKRLVVRI